MCNENENTPSDHLGVHVMLLPEGGFAIQTTGQPNLGEMQMMLSRALSSIEARMVAETVSALLSEERKNQRIITPGR